MSTFGRGVKTAVPRPPTVVKTRAAKQKAAALATQSPPTMALGSSTPGPSGSTPTAAPPLPSEPDVETGLSDPPDAPSDSVIALNTLTQVLGQLVQGQAAMQSQFQQLSTHLSSLANSTHAPPAAQPVAPPPLQPNPPPAPQGNALLGGIFVPPPTGNTGAGTSLPSLFPDIEEATLQAIGRHTLKPGLIYKLDTRIKEKPTATTLDFENGALIHREREPSIKEYPSWLSLYNPLVRYFNILQILVSLSGNLPAIRQVIFGCNEYLRSLYDLYLDYDWTALLNYHFAFHAKRLAEMSRGDFSQWGDIDGNLQTRFLIGHPRTRGSASKDKSATSRSSADISKQLCNDFNYRTCTRVKCARIHKCKACDSADHGQSSCPNKSKST